MTVVPFVYVFPLLFHELLSLACHDFEEGREEIAFPSTSVMRLTCRGGYLLSRNTRATQLAFTQAGPYAHKASRVKGSETKCVVGGDVVQRGSRWRVPVLVGHASQVHLKILPVVMWRARREFRLFACRLLPENCISEALTLRLGQGLKKPMSSRNEPDFRRVHGLLASPE